MKKIIITVIAIVIAGTLLVTIAALIYETKNPPVLQEPAWDSPQTRELVARACFDCHSNETTWPWFTKLPVGSWLAVIDTARGRNHLNFSEWGTNPVRRELDQSHAGGHEAAEVIQEGEMPPALYLMMHPNARLTDAEKQQLITGLEKSLVLH